MPGRKYFEEAFVAMLAEKGEVKHAAELSGVDRDSVYYRRRVDPEFDQQCRDALQRFSRSRVANASKALRRANLRDF